MWPFDPSLRFAKGQWCELCETLHLKTQGAHESGAFLLGTRRGRRRLVSRIIYYDELDPRAYASGVCILHAPAFAALWRRCEELRLEVVADIHVHPSGAWQSTSDRENPMIAQKGHLALILPDFARLPVRPSAIGFHEYLGRHQWRDLGGRWIAWRLNIGA